MKHMDSSNYKEMKKSATFKTAPLATEPGYKNPDVCCYT